MPCGLSEICPELKSCIPRVNSVWIWKQELRRCHSNAWLWFSPSVTWTGESCSGGPRLQLTVSQRYSRTMFPFNGAPHPHQYQFPFKLSRGKVMAWNEKGCKCTQEQFMTCAWIYNHVLTQKKGKPTRMPDPASPNSQLWVTFLCRYCLWST